MNRINEELERGGSGKNNINSTEIEKERRVREKEEDIESYRFKANTCIADRNKILKGDKKGFFDKGIGEKLKGFTGRLDEENALRLGLSKAVGEEIEDYKKKITKCEEDLIKIRGG